MKDIRSIVNQDNFFTEERTSPAVSKLIHNDVKTWYQDEETYSVEYTYSNITVSPEGKTVLLIGVNPRDDEKYGTITQQYQIYKAAKQTNPSVRHRLHLNDPLENSRRNAITTAYNLDEKPVKNLLTLDLFAYRTYQSDTLLKIIKSNPQNTYALVGSLNLKVLQEYINDPEVDCIIIAWGNLGSKFWEHAMGYRDLLIDALSSNLDKCYWYGQLKDGSPCHVCNSRCSTTGLRKVTTNDLKKIFHI